MERVITLLSLLLLALTVGCQHISRSDLGPLQSRALHSRDVGRQLDARYDEVWWGTVTALQDAGFVLRQADKNAGFIYGVWIDTSEPAIEVPLFGIPLTHQVVEVSITLEQQGETSTVLRLSARMGAGGESQDDAQFPQRFFAAVQKEVFVRTTARRLGGIHMSPARSATTMPSNS